jgi:hypothetical protein
MSQGQDTQTNINILMGLMIAAALAMVAVMAKTLRTSTLSLGLLGLVFLLGAITWYVGRCRQCGHDTTKDAEGERMRKSWPLVNETCANCGAEIP